LRNVWDTFYYVAVGTCVTVIYGFPGRINETSTPCGFSGKVPGYDGGSYYLDDNIRELTKLFIL